MAKNSTLLKVSQLVEDVYFNNLSECKWIAKPAYRNLSPYLLDDNGLPNIMQASTQVKIERQLFTSLQSMLSFYPPSGKFSYYPIEDHKPVFITWHAFRVLDEYFITFSCIVEKVK